MARSKEELETEKAAAEAGAIGGRAPDDDSPERPVREAGGGVAEGFEQAEEALQEHAEHTDLGRDIRRDAFPEEAESDRVTAVDGEADELESTERAENDE